MSKEGNYSYSSGIINIASITDHLNTPSSRFRVRQYIDQLSHEGIKVKDFPRLYSTQSAGLLLPQKRIRTSISKFLLASTYEILNIGNTFCRALKSRNYDAAWISREVIIGYPSFEKIIKYPYFYDIDDAVFLRGNIRSSGIKKLMKDAIAIFAGNQYLADYCSQYSSTVCRIPTAVDTDRFVPASRNLNKREFIIGWSGTSTSYSFFEPLETELAKFFENHKDTKLKICSDRFPTELRKLTKYIDFEPWHPEIEVSQVQTFDVGIMPLEDSYWVRGKCSYKMLLYASCGIPTVTSPYGMNQEVLSLGRLGIGCKSAKQWREALEFMYENRGQLSILFPDCRNVILENYSLYVISQRISKEMRAALNR